MATNDLLTYDCLRTVRMYDKNYILNSAYSLAKMNILSGWQGDLPAYIFVTFVNKLRKDIETENQEREKLAQEQKIAHQKMVAAMNRR